jgi:phage regulator Rha-like protein
MNLQDQVKLHKELAKKIEELESQKKDLSIAIMKQMTGKTLSLPGFLVRRFNRLCIKLTIEQARTLNAIKLEETIDKDRVKDMYNKGQSIDGVSEIQYIQISVLQD